MIETAHPNSVTEKGRYRFGVQTRLVVLILLVTVPLLIGVTLYLSNQARNQIESQALLQLQVSNESLSTTVNTWLEYNYRILQELAAMPDILSMERERQEPVLAAFSNVHPGLYLAHTIDLNGMDIGRNDGDILRSYADRSYFIQAKSGAPFVYELLIGRTSGRPALVMAAPIYGASGRVVSVVSTARELDEIAAEVVKQTAEEQISFIVNEDNFVVAHPNPEFTTGAELYDMSNYPPIVAMRNGQDGQIEFTDETGRAWSAYIRQLENGWGIVVQSPQDVLLAPVQRFQTTATVLIIAGALAMLALAWFTIRRSLRPIAILTETASAISAGDFERRANIDSEDEFGLLAGTFNSMTARLRESIVSLEQRVEERTRALQASLEVSRKLSAATNVRQLALDVVDEVQAAFQYYHAHIYFFDDAKEYLVMTGGTGEAGAAMLASGHKIPKGRGLVGRAAETKAPILVPDVSQSIGWLPNPLLPDTQAELAVPIMIGEDVLGVLDVQHNIVNGLGENDEALLEAVSGQIAISLQNARSYEKSRAQADLESLANVIGQKIQRTGSIEEALQTAVREVGLALAANRVHAKIGLDDVVSPAEFREN